MRNSRSVTRVAHPWIHWYTHTYRWACLHMHCCVLCVDSVAAEGFTVGYSESVREGLRANIWQGWNEKHNFRCKHVREIRFPVWLSVIQMSSNNSLNQNANDFSGSPPCSSQFTRLLGCESRRLSWSVIRSNKWVHRQPQAVQPLSSCLTSVLSLFLSSVRGWDRNAWLHVSFSPSSFLLHSI